MTGAAGAAAPSVERGPLVRVTNQDPGMCHSESEPALAVTRDGTWVAFNDIGDCLPGTLPGDRRFLTVQLLRQHRAPHQFQLPRLGPGEIYTGDPALAVDADGRSVLAATLVGRVGPHADSSVGGNQLRLAVIRLRPDGTAVSLPSPSRAGVADDKELMSVDRGSRSRYRGRVYVAWDEFDRGQVTLRAFDGRSWLPAVTINERSSGHPDVAVGPEGQVAVVYSAAGGVAARISTDGGISFGPAFRVLAGGEPGRLEPDCPLVGVVGLRQRVIMGPRVAFDDRGRLHVTATVGGGRFTPAAPGKSTARIRYVVREHGRITERAIPLPDGGEQFAAALSVLPDGSAVISHLAVDDSGRSLTAWGLLFSANGRLASRTALSDRPSELPSTETAGTGPCYGLGDYTSVVSRGREVTAAWGSAEGVSRPAGDTDVLMRTLRVP
jgi:hypothetical protein